MGHAIYTISDPRAVILKDRARRLAENMACCRSSELFERVERLAPGVFADVKGDTKSSVQTWTFTPALSTRCSASPATFFTPLFAVSRIAGWCAHRIEEMETCGRIIRPHTAPFPKTSPMFQLTSENKERRSTLCRTAFR